MILGAVTQAGQRLDGEAALDFVEMWESVRYGTRLPMP